MSDAQDFFSSRSFGDVRKGLEAQAKLTSAMFARLDGITRAIGNVIKSIGGLQKVLGSMRIF